ncbi:MAG: hypothetical protein FJY66_04535, partial [Calditrichaeota bacterium]|nr:hypothetical protein [Calditrichota bacterium]
MNSFGQAQIGCGGLSSFPAVLHRKANPMHRSALTLATLWAVCQAALALSPEKFSPPLQEALLSSHPDSMHSVIAHLEVQADIAAVDRRLYETKATRALRHQVVIEALRSVAKQTQGDLLATLAHFQEQGKVQGYTPLWITNCIVINGKPDVFEELSDRNDIRWMERNFKPRLIEPLPGRGPERGRHLDDNHGVPRGIRALNAPRAWYELGITGAGRLVANLDTGVDGAHPALSARWRGRFAPATECWHDPIYGNSFPRDLYGHGTHVMGTMCGNSTATNDSVGVAPNARWIASNAIEQDVGAELNADVLAAFQW